MVLKSEKSLIIPGLLFKRNDAKSKSVPMPPIGPLVCLGAKATGLGCLAFKDTGLAFRGGAEKSKSNKLVVGGGLAVV